MKTIILFLVLTAAALAIFQVIQIERKLSQSLNERIKINKTLEGYVGREYGKTR